MSQELEGTLTNEANLVGTFGTTGGGTTNYNDLINKPSINNVTLQGNKTGAQLGLVSLTDLATVATTGSYNDLTNKPTIPAAQVNSDWNSTSGVSEILNKPTIPTATSDLTNDSGFVTSSDLATVATTGSYTDLTNTPSIPAAQVNSDWNSTSGVSEILNKPTLATVATSGSYNDLSNTPAIPVNSDFSLSGLSDTAISSATQGEVLAVDSNGKWANTSPIVVKYTEIHVPFDGTGEGRLFTNSRKYIVGLIDLTSDTNYIGYTPFFDGSHTQIKGFSRTQQSYSSTPIINSTRKVGVYYLDNITTVNV